MGTRSCVIVKVRKEDIGSTIRFARVSLPVQLQEWIDRNSDGEVWRDESGKERSQPVELKETYIAIYCHWDGYPSGVGKALKEKFNDYDYALNLVSGGFCSVIDERDGVRHYANRGKRGQIIYEKWNEVAPIQGKTQAEVISQIDCQYAYLFDDAHGWRYKSAYDKKSGFKKY